MFTLPDYIKKKLERFYSINDSTTVSLVDTTNFNNIQSLNKLNLIVNFHLVNNIRDLNQFHENINSKLVENGFYVSCGETLEERMKRQVNKVPIGFKNLFLFIDFLYKRVIPKLPISKYLYLVLTRGSNRVLSKTEILGRLISCGFEILEYFEYNNLFYIISKKTCSPKYDKDASYGLLFKMARIGYKGDIIKVYKLRTMYPYSEYCQELAINENDLADSGKIKDDFRVTIWGKYFRRFWLDELPMLINLLKGDMSLVGVRPLSENYFSKYPISLQNKRIQFKPGLIPPYYADLPRNFNEILLSEEKYLDRKIKKPISTDFLYFYKAFINIVFKGARSG